VDNVLFMRKPPVKGETYDIMYCGSFGYDAYKGSGVFTGEAEGRGPERCYEFWIDGGEKA